MPKHESNVADPVPDSSNVSLTALVTETTRVLVSTFVVRTKQQRRRLGARPNAEPENERSVTRGSRKCLDNGAALFFDGGTRGTRGVSRALPQGTMFAKTTGQRYSLTAVSSAAIQRHC